MRFRLALILSLMAVPLFSNPFYEFSKAVIDYSPEVKAARQAYVKAGFDKLSAFSGMLPSAGISHNRYYSWGDEFNELSHETYAWLNQPVFQGFTLSGRAVAAAINEEVYKSRLKAAEIAALQNAAKNYYAYISAVLEEKNQAESIAVMKDRLKELRRRESIGKIRASDRASMETALLSAEASLPALQAAVLNAALKVKQSCGCDITPVLDEMPSYDYTGNTDTAAVSELQPAVIEARKNAQAAETASLLSKGVFLPSASISLKKSINDKPAMQGDLTGILSLQWSLFEGGERVFNMLAYEAAAESARQKLEAEKQNALYMVTAAYNSMKASAGTAALMKAASEAAEKARKMKEEDYTLGMASNLEVISAMSDELEAKKRYARSITQALSDMAVFESYAKAGGEK